MGIENEYGSTRKHIDDYGDMEYDVMKQTT